MPPSPEAHRRSSPSGPDLHLVLGTGTHVAPASATVARTRPSRLTGIDAARVVATLGVIWVHVVEMQGHPQTTAAWGRFGTSFYIAALALFAVRGSLADPRRTPTDELERGAKRLLLPFLGWCAIYSVFYGRHALEVGQLHLLTEWWGPLAGTARHLWFLPFAWGCAALVNWMTRRTRDFSTRELGSLAVSVGVTSYFVGYGIVFFILPREFLHDTHMHRVDRWVEELPLLLTVACLALWLIRRGPPQRSFRTAAWCAGAFVAIEAIYGRWVIAFQETTHHLDARYLSHLAGLALLATFLALPEGRVTRWMSKLRHVTYFTFLAHLIVLESVGGHLYNMPGFGTLPFAVATTLGVFTVASLLGAVVRRIPGLRLLAGAS
ncbi:MAG TPA: acyltransferase [Polyangiaceae bacterium]|nr:acyltransferase [Polyangiaceae bacterium]